MTDPEKWIKHSRHHICLQCRRPVAVLGVKRVSRGWAVAVSCHSDRQTTLVTDANLEDMRDPAIYWFEAVPLPAQRYEIHHHHHIHFSDKEPS